MGKKTLVIGLILGIVIGVPMVYFLIPYLPQSINSGYKKVTVVEGQGAAVSFGDYEYAFAYQPKTLYQDAFFVVSTPTNPLPYKSYPVVVNAIYNVSGIEIIVSEVHDNYIILSVKSTVP